MRKSANAASWIISVLLVAALCGCFGVPRAEADDQWVVVTEAVDLHTAASAFSEAVGKLQAGTRVRWSKHDGDWYYVEKGDLAGWVYQDFVRSSEAPKPTNTPVGKGKSPPAATQAARIVPVSKQQRDTELETVRVLLGTERGTAEYRKFEIAVRENGRGIGAIAIGDSDTKQLRVFGVPIVAVRGRQCVEMLVANRPEDTWSSVVEMAIERCVKQGCAKCSLVASRGRE